MIRPLCRALAVAFFAPVAWFRPSASFAAPVPAFLDSTNTVRVALAAPSALAPLQGVFSITTKRGTVRVLSVEGGSKPGRARRLPRTPGRVILAGTLQSALGGDEWDPDGETTQMTETRPGVFELVIVLPTGHYEYKVARNGSWDENYGAGFVRGGTNIGLDVSADHTIVRFVVDFNAHTVKDSVDNPADVPAPASAPVPVTAPEADAKFDVAVLHLARNIRPDEVSAPMSLVTTDSPDRPLVARDVLSGPEYTYTGNDLGSRWTPKSTTFKVWSPVSSSTDLLLYKSATGGNPRVLAMRRGKTGVWSAIVPGNLHGAFYQYRFHSYGEVRTTTDINCVAANAESTRSMVVDLAKTDPIGWPGKAVPRRAATTEAVVYEVHVRDFTALPSSGVRTAWRGKYLGMVQRNAHVPGMDVSTGLDYLTDLGVTDIHLLPIQNTVGGDGYNWGYATNLFNVSEEHYSTTPNDPVNVIRETKAAVAGFHDAGLRVVMDVVYNHTWPPSGPDSAFWQTVPYYYFRTNDSGDLLNESGVGNALADERPMVRKYVRDSLLYWANEYHIDGFRFDLLGMFTPESVKDWSNALHAARPDILLYGEPWTGGGPIRFGKGAQRGTGVAVFNDNFRGAIRGDTDGSGLGFATGADVPADTMQSIISGSPQGKPGGFTDAPSETINYVSAHDNLSLWDKIRRSVPNASPAEQARSVAFADAIVLLSEGIPFLEGGTEIGRTKGGNGNSYNANDEVNGFHWDKALEFSDVHDYVKTLIGLRKKLPALRLSDAAEVRRDVHFLDTKQLPPNTVAYEVPGGPGTGWSSVLIILHGGSDSPTMLLPLGYEEASQYWLRNRGVVLGHVDRVFNKDGREGVALEPLTAYVYVRAGSIPPSSSAKVSKAPITPSRPPSTSTRLYHAGR